MSKKKSKNLSMMVAEMGGQSNLTQTDLQTLLLQLISEVRVMDNDKNLKNEQIKLDAIRLLWEMLKTEDGGDDITELLLQIKK